MSSDPVGGPLLLQLVLIFINGWFAATEAAVISLNEAKIRHDAEEGDKVARKLVKLLDAPNKFLSTIQICITLAGFLGSAFAAERFAPQLTAWLLSIGVQMEAGVLQTISVVLITLVLSFFTLVLGELVPKRIAMNNPEKIARATCPVILALSRVFSPLVWLLSVSTDGLLKLLGINPKAETEEVTEEEIRMMVDMGGESGAIEETEKEMIENIFEFNNLSAEDVMTHRMDVTAIWVGDDQETILKTILETGLSRFPVYDEDIDDIIGILSTRAYLLECHSKSPRPLRHLLHEAYFVPETVQADALFRDMQKKKVHMSIVVDEYGGLSGIVTMEDLLEEIVGNIYDEFDPQAEVEIVRVEDNLWRVSGSVALRDLADVIEAELPLEEEYDTLGGLVFAQFTTIPRDGSQPEVDVSGLHIKVEKIDEHRVESALVSKLAPADEEESETDSAEEAE